MRHLSLPVVTILKFLIIYKVEPSYFHFALDSYLHRWPCSGTGSILLAMACPSQVWAGLSMGWSSGIKGHFLSSPARPACVIPTVRAVFRDGKYEEERWRERGFSFFVGHMDQTLSVVLETAKILNLFVQWSVGAIDSGEPVERSSFFIRWLRLGYSECFLRLEHPGSHL